MAIKKRTLEEHGAEYTILIDGTQTLTEAKKLFEEKKSPENDTYLVVALPNWQYHVILFSDLIKILLMMGPESRTQPLSKLPIPPASRVVPRDTTESGGEILDWVATHPQSTVVVTDAGKFTGLFVNPDRGGDSGLAGNLSFLQLYGKFIQLSEDPRLSVLEVEPPTCPHCGQQNFYKFNTDRQVYICPNCQKRVEQL
jgi:DNA-directed RNA polymerase subunit RPC12/RpoP